MFKKTDRPSAKTVQKAPDPLNALVEHAEDPDQFIGAGLECFTLIAWAMGFATVGALVLDAAALAQQHGFDDSLVLAIGGLGAALVLVALGMLFSIQVRYTFEHAHIHRNHFFALKLARQREAAAALYSFEEAVAVPAVKALIELRRDTGLLDRRLAIESLKLVRRWRDLSWGPGVLTLAGLGLALSTGPVGVGLALGGALMWAVVLFWASDRKRRVAEVLWISPPEISAAFDPNPSLQATVQRLLRRVNSHFDRLKGVPPARDPGTEEEESGH